MERGLLIQIAPQFRILVAIDAIDGRKYAPSIDMRSVFEDRTAKVTLCLVTGLRTRM